MNELCCRRSHGPDGMGVSMEVVGSNLNGDRVNGGGGFGAVGRVDVQNRLIICRLRSSWRRAIIPLTASEAAAASLSVLDCELLVYARRIFMNFVDAFDIAGPAVTPTREGPEPTLNEEVTEVVGQLSRFWGGFRKQVSAFRLCNRPLVP